MSTPFSGSWENNDKGTAQSAAYGGTAAGYLSMNQPFIVGGGSIEDAGPGLDGYTKFFLPAALLLVAAAIWLRK
ncbi:MAG: hypothetical protein RLO08_00315 [Parvibaculaceae bacterium]|jgi:cyanophycinase-like exopeptidase